MPEWEPIGESQRLTRSGQRLALRVGRDHEARVGKQALVMTLPLCSAGTATWGESGAGGELCEVGVGGWGQGS